ncbi:glucose-induced degradation protein 8-A homolog isoform X3 [Pseudoliparis swirei]|uniref:glucose-induced degradation protein 8-A homolog isoform X3 n=1 Tax=Pseudoliparis swirei TaxID=2059687 RepID=UPI0024BE8A61|nr:glucose-induced degradation protein 8-A homolog isoform X3 [Pseudoliparis swirei]
MSVLHLCSTLHICFCTGETRLFVIPTMSYAEKPEDITKEEWMDKLNNVHIQRADMNRLIMNYLVTEGFKEAAEKFRMESGIEPSVDLDSLDERIKIREMILKGQIQEAIALINSLHPELLDNNRYLYFHLQQQHLIELIRLRETESALEFAQTQLAEQGEESRDCLTEMERTLALLAFDTPEESPFGDLLNMMQRQKSSISRTGKRIRFITSVNCERIVIYSILLNSLALHVSFKAI